MRIPFENLSQVVKIQLAAGSFVIGVRWDWEINEGLQLNVPLLKRNRKEALNGAIITLGKAPWTHGALVRERSDWDNKDQDGYFRPYCSAVVWMIDKALQSLR